MKKILCVIMIVLFSGCGMMNNTPTGKVEELLGKYQSNDSAVLEDLDNVLLNDSSLTEDEKIEYRDFMSKHYGDMVYKVKREKIDGDSATVDVEITVRDYSSALNKANDYRASNKTKFDEASTFATYRLEKLKEVTNTQTYTIVFHLTKEEKEWKIDPMTEEDEKKLNGTYGYNEISSYDIIENNNDEKVTDDSENSSSDNNADTNMNDETTTGNNQE